MLRYLVERKIKTFVDMGWFSVTIKLYGTSAQHGYSRVQNGNVLALVSVKSNTWLVARVVANRSIVALMKVD